MLISTKLSRYAIFVALVISLSIGSLAVLQQSFLEGQEVPISRSVDEALTTDRDLAIYLEALTEINDHALFIQSSQSPSHLLRQTLRAYLIQYDASSDFLSSAEAKRVMQMHASSYVGIGMDIERTASGSIVSFPYPDSPAERAGIRHGDQLMAINGVSVADRSLTEISMLSSEKVGTRVRLSMRHGDTNYDTEISVAETGFPSVSKVQQGPFTVFKLRSFTPQTRANLQDELNIFHDDPLILDLRMNRGGDFHAAVDIAKLFLHAGNIVVTVQSRKGNKVYTAKQDGIYVSHKVYLWQDEYTASAAEVFVAALRDNQRAESIGKTTHGKGTKQDMIELSDGSVLLLTTGSLLTPKGTRYNSRGIDPDHNVMGDRRNTELYVEKLREILGKKRS